MHLDNAKTHDTIIVSTGDFFSFVVDEWVSVCGCRWGLELAEFRPTTTKRLDHCDPSALLLWASDILGGRIVS